MKGNDMCISCPTKKGIENLPKVGTYYKYVQKNGAPVHNQKDFLSYVMGWNKIPRKHQRVGGKYGNTLARTYSMGGHFVGRRDHAVALARCNYIGGEWIIAKFKIRREDIEYIGTTNTYYKYFTITAHKARRVE